MCYKKKNFSQTSAPFSLSQRCTTARGLVLGGGYSGRSGEIRLKLVFSITCSHRMCQPAQSMRGKRQRVNSEGRMVGVENPTEVSLVAHPSFADWILIFELELCHVPAQTSLLFAFLPSSAPSRVSPRELCTWPRLLASV